MFVMEPVTIDDTNMNYSSVPETDASGGWSPGSTYALGVEVRLNHKIYRSVQAGNIGHNPETDDGTWWVYRQATNRWRAFDQTLADPVVYAGDIVYRFTFSTSMNAIAFFGLDASSIRIKITDPIDGLFFDEEYSLLTGGEEIYDAWTYFFSPIEALSDLTIRFLPIWSGCELEITISSGGTTRVGEIMIGDDHFIGETSVDTEVGIIDYSLKERDAFGNMVVVDRGFTKRVAYRFAFLTSDIQRIFGIFSRIRARPAVFSGGVGTDQYGLSVAGFYKEFNVPLTTTISFGTLEVESLS